MKARTFIGITSALALSAAAAGAATNRVTGLVTAETEGSLQITTMSKETTTVSLDSKTGYMKWITHQPWQQDNRASSRFVTIGSCVDVSLGDNGRVAKTVRVNMEGAGTMYDPCKAIR